MTEADHFVVIDGAVTYIIGSHDTTDVQITRHTTHYPHPATPFEDPLTPHRQVALTRPETHTFINSSREFVMLFEVNGRTLKLVCEDYIALAVGDQIRATCDPVPDCPLLVRDWHNKTRGIRARMVPAPLAGVASEIGASIVLLVIGAASMLVSDDFPGSPFPTVIALGALLFASLCAFSAYRGADRLARVHRALDRRQGVPRGTP